MLFGVALPVGRRDVDCKVRNVALMLEGQPARKLSGEAGPADFQAQQRNSMGWGRVSNQAGVV